MRTFAMPVPCGLHNHSIISCVGFALIKASFCAWGVTFTSACYRFKHRFFSFSIAFLRVWFLPLSRLFIFILHFCPFLFIFWELQFSDYSHTYYHLFIHIACENDRPGKINYWFHALGTCLWYKSGELQELHNGVGSETLGSRLATSSLAMGSKGPILTKKRSVYESS
jgi:hypothetical protein